MEHDINDLPSAEIAVAGTANSGGKGVAVIVGSALMAIGGACGYFLGVHRGAAKATQKLTAQMDELTARLESTLAAATPTDPATGK